MAEYRSYTIKGEATLVRLNQVDDVSGKYQTGLIVDSDVAQPLIDEIEDLARTEHPKKFKDGKVRLNYEVLDDGRVQFKMRTADKPKFVDSRNQPIKPEPKIGRGSILKIKGILLPAGFGAAQNASVMVIPNTVMVVSLETSGGGSDFSDDDLEDEGYVANAPDAEEDIADEPPPPKAKPGSRKKVDF